MPKRLAITISGAVSLGSYEAGVLYEIITAVGQHNSHPDTVSNDADQIEIDVLTGASAGGMTAVIAAYSLLYAGDQIKGPKDNPFYGPWVAGVSLDKLLKTDSIADPANPDLPAPEDPTMSIFSSNLIERLARQFITQRYRAKPIPPPVKHPAAAHEVHLGVAVSNLNGVSYSYPVERDQPETGATFPYTRFQDEKTGKFSADRSDKEDREEVWVPWRDAAVASGAFPFAFRVKELLRNVKEYGHAHLDPWPQEEQKFAYTDGGIFQNEPLGLAKKLVDLVDRPPGARASDYQTSDTRFYLYVAPGAKTSAVNGAFTAAEAQLLPTAKAIVTAALSQARFQDWINAEEVNDQIRVFNLRADQLFKTLKNAAADDRREIERKLQAAADLLLPGLFATEPSTPGPDTHEDSIKDAGDRLRRQFLKESTELNAISAETEKAWIDSILVLETAAELNFKDEMHIYGITATGQELSGGGLFAFAGFFDQTLRDNDYNLGRMKTRKFLAQHRDRKPAPPPGEQEPPPDIGPIRYTPTDTIPDIIKLERDKSGEVLLSRLDAGVRERLLEAVSQRADVLVGEVLAGLKVNRFLAYPLRWALTPIKGELRERLGL